MRAAAVGLLLLSLSAPGLAQVRRQVPEYGTTMIFPSGRPICDALTWEHLHGYAMPITGDCENMRRRVAVWTDYDAAEHPTPASASFCAELGGRFVRLPAPRVSIAGLPTVICRRDEHGGRITLTAMAQFGWDRAAGLPYLNHSVILRTTPLHYATDLRLFRTLVSSVRLRQPWG